MIQGAEFSKDTPIDRWPVPCPRKASLSVSDLAGRLEVYDLRLQGWRVAARDSPFCGCALRVRDSDSGRGRTPNFQGWLGSLHAPRVLLGKS